MVSPTLLMNRQEAQFQLSVCRPNGADARDPDLAEALRFARHDPETARWFAAQQRFDAAIAARLQELRPPPGMRAQPWRVRSPAPRPFHP